MADKEDVEEASASDAEDEQAETEEKPEFAFQAVRKVEEGDDITERIGKSGSGSGRKNWQGKLFFNVDGTFHRKHGWTSKGHSGTWETHRHKEIILTWSVEDMEPESLTTEDGGGSFQSETLTLTMKEGKHQPEWFSSKFIEEDGRCMKACLFCCPAAITEHEGEPETVAQKIWDAVETAVEKLDDKIDAIEEKFEDTVEAIKEMAEGIGESLSLSNKFKNVSDNTLDKVAPEAGEMVADEAANFIPAFKQLDELTPSVDLQEKSKEACTDRILGFRQKIHDFCDDVVEYCKQGLNLLGSALKCLYKVVSWILRACKEGVQMAVNMLRTVVPECCEAVCGGCCTLGTKILAWIKKVFDQLVDIVEECVKSGLSAIGCPQWICEKIDFNGNASAENAADDDEPLKNKAKGADAPGQQSMEASQSSGSRGKFAVGSAVEALFQEDGEWYGATVAEVLAGGRYLVDWDDGAEEDREKNKSQIRAPRAEAEEEEEEQPAV